jgi:hypothetical protein
MLLLLWNMLDLGMLPHSATFTDMAFVLGAGCICDCIISQSGLWWLSAARVCVFFATHDRTLEKKTKNPSGERVAKKQKPTQAGDYGAKPLLREEPKQRFQ